MPARSSSPPPTLDRVPWAELKAGFLEEFEQGEHIAIFGPTGTGKTTLAFDLLDALAELGMSVLILANKPADATLSKMTRAGGWRRIKSWPPRYEHRHPSGPGAGGAKVIVWPSYGRASTARLNKPVFTRVLDEALHERGWVIYVDEMRYLIEQLGLRHLLDEYWNAARSSSVTLIAGAQGPSWIPRGMTTQETWLFSFRASNEDDAKELAKVAGYRDFAAQIMALEEKRHEFILEKTRSHEGYISRVT